MTPQSHLIWALQKAFQGSDTKLLSARGYWDCNNTLVIAAMNGYFLGIITWKQWLDIANGVAPQKQGDFMNLSKSAFTNNLLHFLNYNNWT